MPLRSLVNQLINTNITTELVERSKRDERLLIKGTSSTAKIAISTALAKKTSNKLLIIVPTLEEASRWFSLIQLAGWNKSFLYPTSEASPYEYFDQTSEIIWGQLQVLSELNTLKEENDIALIATERALQPHLPEPDYLYKRCISIENGQNYDLDKLSKDMVRIGYKRVATIEQEGTWARRGDIVDIYPVSNELPIRLEFYGNELEKIKEFDPGSQRSLEQIDKICITPTGFNPLIAERLRNTKNPNIEELLDSKALEQLIEGGCPEGMRRLLGIAWEKPSSLLDYIQKDTFIALVERDQSKLHNSSWIHHVNENFNDVNSKLTFKNEYKNNLHNNIDIMLKEIEQYPGIDISEYENTGKSDNIFDISNKRVDAIPNQFGNLAEKINSFTKDKNKVFIISAQPSRASALLQEHDCYTKFVPNPHDVNSINKLTNDNTAVAIKLSIEADLEGFFLPSCKIVLITDKEFFGQRNLYSSGYIRRRRSSSSKKIDPNKMVPGDYVVHRNHGIGLFQRIEKITINSESRDYLVIKYLDGKLSVAADQLGTLCRYRGSSTKSPKVNKLGGTSWFKSKERTKKALAKVAIDLVKLYAERSKEDGYSYPIDGPWQKELEDSFPYEPTPDQLKAVLEVKADMEKTKPMDRLICGDVGFGKTEVAIRAIFKAITSGKQIALLAPTTVLAQQHWRTISDRFAPYPIKVSLLNRFRTNKEKNTIMTGIKEGLIDAVVGTHQLLGKKVSFKNLGLLVIDEEQRFGVSQKEKIKELKKSVDVLTLSATPIPRTLYMSISGVREMSLITTPPPLRRPIKTHLMPMDEEAIRSAIRQEMDRGGQVFYVVPRVEGIEEVSNNIKRMIPNINLLIAHGQMQEGELENAMVAFNAGEADLMLCTTIVESGLDIPRVNTIIIEDSHKFGLSQLYQLRGRVGRSGIQAHAWLFFPDNQTLNEASKQRLRAIQEFSELGSGYQLAMRDMEIRGVGNILGVEQSGQMESIGFELYMELLQECLAEIQGQSIPKVDDVQIDLQLTAFIPGEWITNSTEKISAYRAATQCEAKEDLVELASEWIDRYGSLPKPVESLLEIMKLKLKAKRCGFTRIRQVKQNIELETPMDEPAFRLIRKGMPDHLQQRLIFKKGDINSKVLARGLGVLTNEKQLDTILDWMNYMEKQVDQINIEKSN